MPINQPPATAPIPRIASIEATTSSRRSAENALIQRVSAGFGKIQSTIGLSGIATVAVGVALAVWCTIWAILEGVPHPLAIMVGYCTLVGSACLYAALLVIQNLSAKVSSAGASRRPNYLAWNHVSALSVSDASRLWCDIEPGCPSSQESIAWGMAMLDAVKRGELPTSARAGTSQAVSIQEQSNPNWHTEVTREGLRSWAQAHGHSPRFLQK
jgi:hypothetical protein